MTSGNVNTYPNSNVQPSYVINYAGKGLGLFSLVFLALGAKHLAKISFVFCFIGLSIGGLFSLLVFNNFSKAQGFFDYVTMAFQSLGILFGGVFTLFGLSQFFIKTELQVTPKHLLVTYNVLGFVFKRNLNHQDICSYNLRATSRINEKAWYDIYIESNSSRNLHIPCQLSDKNQALLLAEKLTKRSAA